MQEFKQLGNVTWTYDELRRSIPEFLDLYKQKPLNDNQGGMKSPHMFAAWFLLKKIQPKYVIESGVWKGQGTWLIEKTLPESKIYSIDLNLSIRKYISDKVQYFDNDFSEIDWSIIPDKENTVLFFDDHQNALERIKSGSDIGFRHFLFEDNYPTKQGDCYSLKKAFQHSGFNPYSGKKSFKQVVKNLVKQEKLKIIPPNPNDAQYLKDTLEVYYEFPPVFTQKNTRWGDHWDEVSYPTPEPLFKSIEHDYLNLFYQEAIYYTWFCYAKIK